MKISLNKRLKIERIWVFLGLALLAVAALLLALAFLGPRFASLERSSTSSLSSTPAGASPTISSSSSTPETASTTDTSDTAPPGSTSTTEPLAASVNGYAITQSYLSETVRLNLVLGELSGTSTMSEEETLQRLIRSQLILQGVEDLEEPTQQDIESFISGLQGSWGVSDEVVVEMLQGVGLDRSFLEDTIQRLLTVEAGVETLQDQGHSIAEWLSEQEQDADITVFGDALGEEEAEVSPTTPDPVQTDTPGPTPASQSEIPEIAPDFTLSRAGGGSFTLMDQLDKGPVVLVFFEKCG